MQTLRICEIQLQHILPRHTADWSEFKSVLYIRLCVVLVALCVTFCRLWLELPTLFSKNMEQPSPSPFSLSFLLLSSFPFPCVQFSLWWLLPCPLNPARRSGECCKLLQWVNHEGEKPQLTAVQAANNTLLHLESESDSCLCPSYVFIGLISVSLAFLHDES